MTLSELKIAIEYPNLTVRALAVLFVIGKSDNMRVKDIAVALRMPKPSVSRAFDSLGQLGLMFRAREEIDKRYVYGVMTEKGEKLLKGLAG